ncbi:coiled-coil domain-containing protein 162-like [Ciconia boyciana]|uniref:coiled-coil domain-containing protein 162-like n=1 Tax=Ciconia boyciana TaxID=52775 RepID=UPI003BA14901
MPLNKSVLSSLRSSGAHVRKDRDLGKVPKGASRMMKGCWVEQVTQLGESSVKPSVKGKECLLMIVSRLCLCSLSHADRRVAHGELVAMQFLTEGVLQNSYGCAVEDHADRQASLATCKQQNLAETVDSSANWLQNSKRTCKLLLRHHDLVISRNLLRSFLILWKQLEILKAEWGRLKLRTEDISTVPLSKEFCEQYGAAILYPAMKAIVRQTGTEEEFGEPVTSPQRRVPPRGPSEIEMKVYQLQKLLENLEMHMIRDVRKKINQEMTLVTSERARQGSSLPTELWKHRVMQENFSVVQPQIVETFVQRLMENYQESDTEITLKKSHLQQCLTILGCDMMARERSNFETYSMFYENIRRQQHRLLYPKEQELHAVEEGGNQSDMALMQGKLDVYRLSIEQRVFEIISEVRREGVDNMIDLKKKFGSTKNNGDLKEHLSKEALQNKKECLNAEMMAEQEVTAFQGQLVSVRKALAKSQADNDKLKKQLHKPIRSQLTQECSLKREAFQQVDELQCQVYDLEATVSQRNATAGSTAEVQSKLSASTQHGDYQQHPLNFDPRSSNGTGGNTQRPKTVSNGGIGNKLI